MKPMLCCDVPTSLDPNKLYAISIKYDGVRGLTHPTLGPVTRNFKPIVNTHIRSLLKELPHWLEFEIVAGTFQETVSAVMSEAGEPIFKIYLFDLAEHANDSYRKRWGSLSTIWLGLGKTQRWVRLAETRFAHVGSVKMFYNDALKQGYEGLIIRDLDQPYKYGRGTSKGQFMRMKPVLSTEGVCKGVVPAMHNTNEQTRDELGRAKRSTAKGGMVKQPWAGALVLEHSTFGEFKVSGFDHATAKSLWDSPPIGSLVEFEYRGLTAAGKPRHPIYKGLRLDLK